MATKQTNITELGKEGEDMARTFLKSMGYKLFQPDFICERKGTYSILEIKHQEMFESPPFDGHGEDIYKIDARLKFETITGIKTILMIIEVPTGRVFYQWLHNLMKGKYHDTYKSRKRIFPLESYIYLGGLL